MPPENYKFGCKKPKSVRWWWTFWASFWGSLEPLWPSDYSSSSCGKYSQLFMIAGNLPGSKRSMLAKWDTGENPIFKQATSTFKNPTY